MPPILSAQVPRFQRPLEPRIMGTSAGHGARDYTHTCSLCVVLFPPRPTAFGAGRRWDHLGVLSCSGASSALDSSASPARKEGRRLSGRVWRARERVSVPLSGASRERTRPARRAGAGGTSRAPRSFAPRRSQDVADARPWAGRRTHLGSPSMSPAWDRHCSNRPSSPFRAGPMSRLGPFTVRRFFGRGRCRQRGTAPHQRPPLRFRLDGRLRRAAVGRSLVPPTRRRTRAPIADQFRAVKERWMRRRAARRADKPDRLTRKRAADAHRIERKRKGGGSGSDGGAAGGIGAV